MSGRRVAGVFIMRQRNSARCAHYGTEAREGVVLLDRTKQRCRCATRGQRGALVRRAGATMLETVILIGAVVAALVAMSRYIQRGYLGYLYSNGSVHGQQFDPRESFQAVDTLHHFSQTIDTDIISGQAAVTFFQSSGASGTPPSRALGARTKVVNDWDFGRDAQITARK